MDTYLAPIHVANHWPYIERMLNFHRWRTGRRALELVATLQNEAGGQPVDLGRSRIQSLEGSNGFAPGAIWRTLVDLEGRAVVTRRRGAGRKSDAWSLRADLSHWRRMPWEVSGRDVERVVGSCICRASCPVAARNPAQEVFLPRGFKISPHDHLPLPGWGLVDMFSNGAMRAATAQSPAWSPVDSRGNGAKIHPLRAPLTVLSVDLEDLLTKDEAAAERHARFVKMIDKRAIAGHRVIPGLEPDRKLMRLALDTTDLEAEKARILFAAKFAECGVPSGVQKLETIVKEILDERAEEA